MRKFKIFIILIFILGCVILASFFIWEIYFSKNPNLKEEKIFLIKKGESLNQIAKNLKKENLIKNKNAFLIYALLTQKYKKLQAGYYKLNPAMNIPEITEKFVLGEIVKEKLVIIEGWNLRDIGFYFENKGICQAEELWELVGFPLYGYLPSKDFSKEFNFLTEKSKNLGLEGYLFPNSYQIDLFKDNLENIIKKMLENFDKKLNKDLREEIFRQKKTIFEIITMASLLEKEVKTFEDKKLVSGILWKRLKNKIPLQVDATITYITGKKTTKISIAETQIDSPYNTYKYLGLPKGPICNPSLDSILAAIYPKDSNFWYYLSTPEGKTIFSKTFKEHQKMRAKYLR
jgi:UPF0755 protein